MLPSRPTPESAGSDGSDPDLLDLLHAIRLRGLVEATELSRLTTVPAAEVRTRLQRASSSGLVAANEFRGDRWSLTELGRAVVGRMLAAEIEHLGVRAEMDVAFRRFTVINTKVLAVCTSWQVITVGSTTVPNDHRDADHDAAVLDRFEDLHRRAVPLVQHLGQLSPRFSGYDGRLTMAHERISEGETQWLTLPTVDSYHSIWFELHENLLANLGRERSDGRNG